MSHRAIVRRETAPAWWEEAREVGTKVSSVEIPNPTWKENEERCERSIPNGAHHQHWGQTNN